EQLRRIRNQPLRTTGGITHPQTGAAVTPRTRSEKRDAVAVRSDRERVRHAQREPYRAGVLARKADPGVCHGLILSKHTTSLSRAKRRLAAVSALAAFLVAEPVGGVSRPRDANAIRPSSSSA